MPPPSQFGVPRYALWVYVPNYQVKMYIGDLPITLHFKQSRRIRQRLSVHGIAAGRDLRRFDING